MKVGILTFHDGPNHGAFLQAYALMKIIQEKGHDGYIINYKNKRHHVMESYLPILRFRRPIRFIDFYKKHRAFKIAHKHLNLTPRTTNPTVVKKNHFDLAVIGSDVVWNYKIFGLDDLFFGDLNANKIISYAPSFGWVTTDEIIPGLADKLRRFDKISVRDTNTKNIVKKTLNVDAPIVLDPTLIYNFNDDEKNTYNPQIIGDYILVYSYISNDEVIGRIKKVARDNDLKIVAVGYRQLWCDKVFMGVGPFEWLSLFENAKTILTSTFHGTIFSIKNEKPFYFIANEKAKKRVQSLFDTCKIGADLDVDEGQLLKIEPNYLSVNRNLKPEIEKSLDWLSESIDTK